MKRTLIIPWIIVIMSITHLFSENFEIKTKFLTISPSLSYEKQFSNSSYKSDGIDSLSFYYFGQEKKVEYTDMIFFGLSLKKYFLITSIYGILPFHEGKQLPFCLNINLGLHYKKHSIYYGLFTDFKSNKNHKMICPYYIGCQTGTDIFLFELDMNAQYLYGKYNKKEYGNYHKISSFNGFNLSSRISYPFKVFNPYFQLSFEKLDFYDNWQYNVSLRLSLGNISASKSINPKKYAHTYYDLQVEKPNIYLYPEEECDIKVKISPNGYITTSIPEYYNGWDVHVQPDGRINDTYDFLFYEAKVDIAKPEKGWCINYEELVPFFNETLTKYNLNKTEIEDFIDYWSKRLIGSDYYLIHPLTNKEIEEICPIEISPAPEHMLRLWFIFSSAEEYVKLPSPDIIPVKREGYFVVEWGGTILYNP